MCNGRSYLARSGVPGSGADILYIFGARGIAGFSMEIAKWLVIIFVFVAVITFLVLINGASVRENQWSGILSDKNF
jgi:disulfide bond formation protein DsbB